MGSSSKKYNQKLAKRYKISVRKFILTLSVVIILAITTVTVNQAHASGPDSFLAKVYEFIQQGQKLVGKQYAENANPQAPYQPRTDLAQGQNGTGQAAIDVNTGLPAPTHIQEVAGITNIDPAAFSQLQQQVNNLQLQLSQPASSNSNVTVLDTAGVNLLRNSSFEAGGLGSIPSQWNAQLDSTTGNTYISQEGIHSGNYGLKFAGGGSGNFGISQPNTKTVPQRTYTFSAWVKNVNAAKATIRIGFWDEQNNKEGSFKGIPVSGTKDWYRISTTVTTPGQITDLKNWFPMLEVQGLTSGNVYVDDVLLTEGSVLTDYNTAQANSGLNSSTLGDGAILGSSGGDLYPAQSGVGQLGTSSNRWSALNLSKATIDNNGNLNLSGGLTVQALGSGIMHVGSGGAVTSSAVNLANSDITGTLPVSNGGTGQTSFTANGVLYGNGANAIQVLAPGTSGYLLQTNGSGSAPTWVAASSVGSAFSSISSGTNTTATMTVGSGASLAASGTGTITATGADSNSSGGTLSLGVTNAGTVTIGNNTTSTAINVTSGTGTQTYTSSATTGNAFVFTGNSVTTGNGILGTFNGLTTGTGLSITSSGTITSGGQVASLTGNSATTGNVLTLSGTGLTSGSVLAATAGTTTGNAASITANGLTTGTGMLLTSTGTLTTTGNLQTITANSATTATGVQTINATGLTTGFAENINANGATSLTSGGGLNVVGPTGAATISNNAGLVQINATGNFTTTAGSGGLLDVIDNSVTTGTLASISDSAVMTTTGNLLTLTGNAATTTNGLLTVNANGLTTGTGVLLTSSGVITSGGQVLSVVGSGVTTGNAATITANGLTTGNILSLTSSSAVASHNSVGLNISLTGAGATSTNTAASFSATGGTTANYGLLVTNGSVGIGTSTPIYTLDLQTSQSATAAAEIFNTNSTVNASGLVVKLGFTGAGTVPSSQTTGNNFIRFLNGSGVAQGSIDSNGNNSVTYNTTGIDFAEWFVKDGGASFEEGDLVVTTNANNNIVNKSSAQYDDRILGIVSSHPGFTGGASGPNKVLVGLVGQLPLKVSTENGSINQGDFLTSSSVPGVAMKSTKPGQTVGRALENYTGSGVGKIQVYVSAGYADPMHELVVQVPQTSPTPTPSIQQVQVSTTATTTSSTQPATLDIIAATSGGGVVIGNDIEFKGQTIFDKIATYISNVVLKGDVSFFGRPKFNNDTAGRAVIAKGANTVYIPFQRAYDQLPEVNISITLGKNSDANAQTSLEQAILTGDIKSIVTQETVNGFVIEINKAAPNDITFSWTALAVQDATVNTGSTTVTTSLNSTTPTLAPAVTTLQTTPSVTPPSTGHSTVSSDRIGSGSSTSVSPVPGVIPSVSPTVTPPAASPTPAPSTTPAVSPTPSTTPAVSPSVSPVPSITPQAGK